MFEAIVLRSDNGRFTSSVERLDVEDLGCDGDVLVDVHYSSLNYKDALALTNRAPIVRATFPFVPGIDLAGEVAETNCETFAVGDRVVATGGGLGETRWGGYAGRQRVSSEWLVKTPAGLDSLGAMILGTAGLTAMLAVMAIERNVSDPGGSSVLVTGASGGVGSFAVKLLSDNGYDVTASTGSSAAHEYLHSLGASSILDRSVLEAGPGRPMDTALWDHAVDTVGGSTLAAAITKISRHGCIAVCGLAAGPELHTSVYPLILRGVNLLGIESTTCPLPVRKKAWKRLSKSFTASELDSLAEVIPLSAVSGQAERLLAGQVTGRIAVAVGGH